MLSTAVHVTACRITSCLGSTLLISSYYRAATVDRSTVAPQGGGQQALGTNWGDGFATDPALLQGLGLSDPRPFFDALERKPYAGQASGNADLAPAAD